MKILIIRFSSIGDIVLTTPVVRCLKKQLPGVEIHFLTKSSYKEIIEHNPYIDVKHYLDDSLGEMISILKKEKFDLIVDLHSNLRTAIIRTRLWRKSIAFNKLNLEKWIYVNFKLKVLPNIHIVDRYLETVYHLGVRNDGGGLDYFFGMKDEVRTENLPLTHIHGYVALVIGSKHNTKKLTLVKLKNLCRLLPYPIIILGGTEDKATGDTLAEEEPFKILNGCGRYSLNESASLIGLAKVVITHDTGLMHVAAAFKRKIVSVWGNTVPAFGMYPYFGKGQLVNPNSEIVEIKNLSCRPCSKIGYEKCPKKHFKCINLIDENNIVELIKKF